MIYCVVQSKKRLLWAEQAVTGTTVFGEPDGRRGYDLYSFDKKSYEGGV